MAIRWCFCGGEVLGVVWYSMVVLWCWYGSSIGVLVGVGAQERLLRDERRSVQCWWWWGLTMILVQFAQLIAIIT